MRIYNANTVIKGAPGWNIFVQPLLEQVNPSLVAETAMKDGKNPKTNDEEVVDLRRLHIIVTSQCLYLALGRLEALIISNPSPSLCKRVTRPILMQLWCLASWASPSVETEKELCRPARNLLKAYFRLFGTVESILPLTQNIMCTGSTDTTAPTWRYRLNKDGLVEIATYQEAAAALPEAAFHLDEIDHKAAVMVDTIISACSNEHISSIFLDLLRRWLNSAGRQSGKEILLASPKDEAGSHIQYIVELSMLQKLMEKAPEKLVGHFDQLLEVICQVMHADKWADLGDELLAVVLSLLNMVLTSTSFRKSEIDAKDLKTIEESLVRIENSERPEVSATARNLAMILRYHDEIEASDEFKAAPSIRQVEDNKTYNLAMSYITGDGDNPPPVVAEGLNLLSGLIMAESPILDITAVMVLMSSLLKENEDFIYLRVIKVFTQLAKKHPRSTIQEILDNYLDAQEKLSTDVRLRFGEALLQVIERLGEAFAGDVAKQACETLLSIAGRRGHRLKAMAKEEKEARLKEMKRRREEADGEKRRKLETGASHRDEDDGGDLPGDEELVSEEEQYRQDVLARIIQGWESKRGSEDVRMRTSALSIFGSALETNLGGIDPATISDGVEVSLSVLTLERGLEHIILRRAAVLMILSLVRALDQAREAKRALGFGLSGESRRGLEQALGYIADTDEDGLVREQARDAAESLENWQLGSFLRPRDETSVAQGINQLSGLRVRPETVIEDETGRLRPRIEEIE